MAHYLVRAKPNFERLNYEEFEAMRPFGWALTTSLENARYDPETSEAVWEEEDYCSPPLAMERDAVLNDYFEDIAVEQVNEGKGWGAD